jgi:hypothetical protein
MNMSKKHIGSSFDDFLAQSVVDASLPAIPAGAQRSQNIRIQPQLDGLFGSRCLRAPACLELLALVQIG